MVLSFVAFDHMDIIQMHLCIYIENLNELHIADGIYI